MDYIIEKIPVIRLSSINFELKTKEDSVPWKNFFFFYVRFRPQTAMYFIDIY